MKVIDGALFARLQERYGCDSQLLVRFAGVPYGSYDTKDEEYTFEFPLSEGKLNSLGSLSFEASGGIVQCAITFKLVEPADNILDIPLDRATECMVAIAAVGGTELTPIYKGTLTGEPNYNRNDKTYTLNYSNDYSKIQIAESNMLGELLPIVFGNVVASPTTALTTAFLGKIAADTTLAGVLDGAYSGELTIRLDRPHRQTAAGQCYCGGVLFDFTVSDDSTLRIQACVADISTVAAGQRANLALGNTELPDELGGGLQVDKWKITSTGYGWLQGCYVMFSGEDDEDQLNFVVQQDSDGTLHMYEEMQITPTGIIWASSANIVDSGWEQGIPANNVRYSCDGREKQIRSQCKPQLESFKGGVLIKGDTPVMLLAGGSFVPSVYCLHHESVGVTPTSYYVYGLGYYAKDLYNPKTGSNETRYRPNTLQNPNSAISGNKITITQSLPVEFFADEMYADIEVTERVNEPLTVLKYLLERAGLTCADVVPTDREVNFTLAKHNSARGVNGIIESIATQCNAAVQLGSPTVTITDLLSPTDPVVTITTDHVTSDSTVTFPSPVELKRYVGKYSTTHNNGKERIITCEPNPTENIQIETLDYYIYQDSVLITNSLLYHTAWANREVERVTVELPIEFVKLDVYDRVILSNVLGFTEAIAIVTALTISDKSVTATLELEDDPE